MGPTPVLELESVTKTYDDGRTAVRGLSLAVRHGERLVLLGPSGSGKTTVLRLVNGLIRATAGLVRFRGEALDSLDTVALRRRMGYVIQQAGLFPHLTVEENVTLPLRLAGWSAARRAARARKLLRLVRLPRDVLGRHPRGLSGGQQQRVGLARALSTDPEVILMDEPFGALDPLTRVTVRREVLAVLHALRKTVIMVTHDIAEAWACATRIALLNQGRLEQCGSPRELRRRPATPFVRAFLAGSFPGGSGGS